MEKAWIYCRTASNNESNLDSQYKECENYAKDHGWEIAGSSKDVGSGLNLDRAGGNEILKAAKQNKFDILLMKDVSRIGRDLNQLLEYMDKLKPYSTKIFSTKQGELNLILLQATQVIKTECEKIEAEYDQSKVQHIE